MRPSIGLIGRKQSGKDTAGNYLCDVYGYGLSAFADPLRQLATQADPIVSLGGWSFAEATRIWGYEAAKAKFPEYRRTLQALGVGVRTVIGEDVWVDAWRRSVNERLRVNEPIVVTDVRFPNEAAALTELGFVLVRVTRFPNDADTHISEIALDEYPVDVAIDNTGTYEQLHAALDAVVSTRRTNAA